MEGSICPVGTCNHLSIRECLTDKQGVFKKFRAYVHEVEVHFSGIDRQYVQQYLNKECDWMNLPLSVKASVIF